VENVVSAFLLVALALVMIGVLVHHVASTAASAPEIPVTSVVAYGDIEYVDGEYRAEYLINYRISCVGVPVEVDRAVVGLNVGGESVEVKAPVDGGLVVDPMGVTVSVVAGDTVVCDGSPGGRDHYLRVSVVSAWEPTLLYVVLEGESPSGPYTVRIYIPDGRVIPFPG